MDVRFTFNDKAPDARKAAEDNAASMVTDISAETEANIRSLIADAIESKLSPYEAAQEIHDLIGLTAAQGQAAQKYRDELEASGLTADKVEAKVEEYADELLTARAETIARTEIMEALNAGQDAAWAQAQEAGLLSEDAEKEWITTPDETLCPECNDMDGETVPIGQEFPDGDPPLHPNCRCTVGISTP